MINVDIKMSETYMNMLKDSDTEFEDIEHYLECIDDGYICPYCGSCYDLDHIDEHYEEGENKICCPNCEKEFVIEVSTRIYVDVIVPHDVLKEVQDE